LFASPGPLADSTAENRSEEKSIKQAIKDIAHAEKNEAKGAKAETHAHSVSPSLTSRVQHMGVGTDR
jgi:hypothetical protein